MNVQCPRDLLIAFGLKNPRTGEEIVYNPPGFDYKGELEAVIAEASQLAYACKEKSTRNAMKGRWKCETVADLDLQYHAKFVKITVVAQYHLEMFTAGQTVAKDNHDYCVNNEVRVLQKALQRVRDVEMPTRAGEWP